MYRECRFLLPFHFSVTNSSTPPLTLCFVDVDPVFVGVHVGFRCVGVYSLGTVINANNSNNKTSLAITTTTTNNYVHLILLSSCLLRTLLLHVFSTLVYSTLIFLPSSWLLFLLPTVCSACYCWYCCCCRCLRRRRRRPRRLILLEHNFNFCYVANTTAMSHTFPFASLVFAVPHTASCFTSLISSPYRVNPSIGSMSRPPPRFGFYRTPTLGTHYITTQDPRRVQR